MRYISLLAAGIFLNAGSLLFAAPASVAPDSVPVPRPPPLDQPAPAAQAVPATQPAPIIPAPTAVPEAPHGQVAPAEGGSVLVLPFAEITSSANPWVGRAIQQDLVVDLVRTTRAHIQAPGSTSPVADVDAAIAAGRQAGASHVVYGQLQSSGGQMRATGQILDVATARPVGGFNATAPSNDLFPLEDSVTMQVLRALPAAWVTVPLPPPTGSAPEGSAPAPVPPPASPISTQEYYSYTYPDYASAPGDSSIGTYWGYPYYWYTVPYYGPDFIFFGGFDHFHHHFWGHGWDRGHFGHFYGGFHPSGFHGFSHTPSFHGGGGHFGGGGHAGGGGHGR